MTEVRPWEWDWSAIAAFAAAAVAVFVAWRNTITADEIRRTTFNAELLKLREKWVWDLRQQMAEFVAIALRLKNMNRTDAGYSELRQRFDHLYSLIPFMMDPEEDKTALNAVNLALKSSEAQHYYVPFSDVLDQLNKVEGLVAGQKPLGTELATLEKIFHRYLRYHWINLQQENVRPHA